MGSRTPPMKIVRCPRRVTPSILTWYGVSRKWAPDTRQVFWVICSYLALVKSSTPPGPGRRSGRVFSYKVWAATDRGVQRSSGAKGVRSNESFRMVAIMDRPLGTAQMPPHSMILPMCHATLGKEPRDIEKAANGAGSYALPPSMMSVSSLRASRNLGVVSSIIFTADLGVIPTAQRPFGQQCPRPHLPPLAGGLRADRMAKHVCCESAIL